MNVNINSIELEKGKDQKGFRLSLTSDSHPDKTFYYFGENELEFFVECALGRAKFYPYFDDGLYAIKVCSDGIKCVYTSEVKQFYFYFPVNEVVSHVQDVMTCIETESSYHVDLSYLIPYWIEKYPNVKVIYHSSQDESGEDVKAKLERDVNHPLVKNKEYASEFLAHSIHWAESYSNGNEITLHVCFDSWNDYNTDEPSNYYWYILSTDGQRIVNGGFIAHRRENEDGTRSFEYSIHT